MKKVVQLGAFLVAVLMVLMGTPVAAQDDPQPAPRSDEVQILSGLVDSDGVAKLVVAIPPSMGRVNPEANSFALLQSGELRGLVVEEQSDQVDVVLVVDTSGSMRGAPIVAAKQAAADFVTQMPEGTRVAVIGFGAEPALRSGLTLDREESQRAIGSLSASGETALWDALVAAADLIESEGRSAPYVVLLSDGGDTASNASSDEAVEAMSELSSAAGLYVVTLETTESDHEALNDASERLSGQVLNTTDSSSLGALYVEIAERLQSRYLVRFRPNDGENIVLSVAVDGSVATARTTLTAIGGVSSPIPTEQVTEIPAALNGAAVAELGAVVAIQPGLLGEDKMLWAGAAASFAALLVMFGMLSVPAMKVQPVGAVRGINADGAHALNDRLSGAADRLLKSHDQSGSVDRTLDAAGIDVRAGEALVMLGTALISVGLVASLLGGPIVAGAAVLLVALASIGVINLRVSRRRNAFAEQLQSTISIITGSLRSGRGLPQAIEMVAQEASSPTSDEFRRVVIETRVGRDPVTALDGVAERMKSVDLEWISQAIAVNRELGGDLIELLENVSRTIRDRNRIGQQVRSLSAEGRLSGWVMLGLPVVMYGYLRVVNPEYISLLHTTSIGIVVSVAGIVAMLGGGLWIRKLVNIRF
jgi:tight adherence protein B